MFQKILMGLFNNLMNQKVTETIEILLEDRQDKKIGLLYIFEHGNSHLSHLFYKTYESV